ncbi:MAG: ABC transporter ATP-binding protein [Deltaproteobacteria bacterium]|nr:MAG: ABC transporter ATP-binding protein [Deltaproteobacteria bacterium]
MAEHLLNITGLTKAYGPRVLFDDVTFGLDAGDKIGLIGDNGAGKSTFLAILAGTQEPDAGQIAIKNGIHIGLLEQVPHLDPTRTAREIIAEPFAPLVEAIHKYEAAAAAVDPEAETWLHAIEQLGGWDWAHKVEKVASEVGVEHIDVPVSQLSGGQQRRVALARLLLEEPDILLFDEPTNHLDAETTEWLEGWIGKTRSACVIVTHDRYFLENVVTRMAEVRDGQLKMYQGRYQDYLSARAEEEELRRRTGQRRLQVLKNELDWARRSPSARSTKQRARLERVDGLADEVKKLQQETRRADFQLDSAPRLGKTILELAHVSAGFDELSVIEDLTMMLRRGDRVGIIGPNGSGKTTMLRLVTGEHTPSAGKVVRGTQTEIAYFDQHRSLLEDGATVRGTVCPEGGDKVFVGDRQLHVVSYLERFGFGAEQHGMRVGSLSGGERNRLALARFLLADANVLLFDEPTNDLDLMTMHTLEEALLGFNGCVLVVSHDRYFLDRVATTMVVFEGRAPAKVTVQPGDYTTWRRLKAQEVEAERAQAEQEAAEAKKKKAAAAAREVPEAAPARRKLSWAERKELEGIEPRIEEAEERVAELDEALSDGAVWADGGTRGRELQAQHDEAKAALDALYARWEELNELAEGA